MDCKRLFSLTLGLFWCCLLQADIFRSEDASGQAVFSDTPSLHAEKLHFPTTRSRYRVVLKRVIDGDTIELTDGSRLRLIGINAPEVENRYHAGEQGGEEAKNWLKERFKQAGLLIEFDAEQLDKYDRQLVHCFLDDGSYLNAELLQQGLAVLTIRPPNTRYFEQLSSAQQYAEKNLNGIWRDNRYLQPVGQDKQSTYAKGWHRWQLKVSQIVTYRRYIRLIVHDGFYLEIDKQSLDLFLPLEQYLGQSLEVRGWVSRRNNQYVIRVYHPSAIIFR